MKYITRFNYELIQPDTNLTRSPNLIHMITRLLNTLTDVTLYFSDVPDEMFQSFLSKISVYVPCNKESKTMNIL